MPLAISGIFANFAKQKTTTTMKAYYIIDGSGKQSGPFPVENLRQHGITPQTYVWCEGMGDNWKKACEVAELAVLFAPQPQSNTTQPIGQNPPIQAGAATTPINPAASGANTQWQPQQPQAQQPRTTWGQQQPGAQQPGAWPQQPQQPRAWQPQQPGTWQQPQQPQQPAAWQQQRPGMPAGWQQPQPGMPGQQGPVNPGFQNNPGPGMRKPDNYLVWTILSTVLCCIPVGAVGIYYSSQVDSAWNRGDYSGAMRNSENAKTYAIISACIGIVVGFIYGILGVINS